MRVGAWRRLVGRSRTTSARGSANSRWPAVYDTSNCPGRRALVADRLPDSVVQPLFDPLVMIELTELGESHLLDLEHFVFVDGERRGIE